MNNYFIKDGKCLYTIVIPHAENKNIEFAANELVYAIQACCGDSLIMERESERTPEYALYLGDTSFSLFRGLKPDVKEVGADGFKIAFDDKKIFIIGATSEGVIYGVYAFLKRVLDCEFFGYGEYRLPKTNEAYLPSEDITVVPDIETRVRSLSWTKYDETTERRFGYNPGNGRHWVTWAHTHFSLIPKEKYWDSNRDFYSDKGNQLCLSNDSLKEEMAKNLISRLTPEVLSKSDLLYLMVGHEDNNDFCECERCQENARKYGGKAGVMMRFINSVADKVNEFMQTAHPEKIVKTITFAYGPTVPAPVVETDEGKYVPIDESVVAHENVAIMLAPLGSDWAHGLLDEKYNARTRKSLLAWQAINAELFIWTYDSVFDDSFIYLDNWKHLAESYRIFRDCGAKYIFDQGHADRCYPFSDMRNYVRAKLMWDVSLDTDVLIRRFMTAYYKEASDCVYEYYKNLSKHFEEVERAFEKKGKAYKLTSYVRTQPYYRSEEFWDKEFLLENIALLENCRAKLENTGRNGALNRLEVEMLSPIYMLMELYGHELEKEKVLEYSGFFERVCSYNGISYYAEWGQTQDLTIYKKLVNWRSLLYREE